MKERTSDVNPCEMPDIPDFLLAANRTPAPPGWKPRTPRRDPRRKRAPFNLPKTMDAAAWAMLREIEREREAKKKARLAALKEARKAGR
jgi:hypothetical protein